MALLVTLLGVLVLEVVIAGAFHVAMQQRRIATSYARDIQLQFAARSTAATALAGWGTLPTDSIMVGATFPLAESEVAGLRTTASLHRVAPELFLLRAKARFAGTGETHAVAAIVRELTSAEFFAGVSAAVVAGEAVVAGVIDGTPPAECDLPKGAPAQIPGAALEDPGGFEGAVALVDPRPFSEVASLDLAGVLSAPPGVLVVPGDFELAADMDEAVLIVHGDLAIQPGVRFRGLLLVGGSLRLLPGSSVYGAIQVGGLLDVEDAAVRYDPCVLAELFRTRSFLRGPLRAAPHWWIPSA